MNCILSALEKAGYEGCDVSLEISLFEYGLIWKKFSRKTKGGFKKGEYRFIYGVTVSGEEYTGFSWAGNIHETTDPKQEWSWVDWNALANFADEPAERLLTLPIPSLVSCLLSCYGYENVFGSAYHEFAVGTKGAPRWSEETLSKRRYNREVREMKEATGLTN